jgi:hypothetical protein
MSPDTNFDLYFRFLTFSRVNLRVRRHRIFTWSGENYLHRMQTDLAFLQGADADAVRSVVALPRGRHNPCVLPVASEWPSDAASESSASVKQPPIESSPPLAVDSMKTGIRVSSASLAADDALAASSSLFAADVRSLLAARLVEREKSAAEKSALEKSAAAARAALKAAAAADRQRRDRVIAALREKRMDPDTCLLPDERPRVRELPLPVDAAAAASPNSSSVTGVASKWTGVDDEASNHGDTVASAARRQSSVPPSPMSAASGKSRSSMPDDWDDSSDESSKNAFCLTSADLRELDTIREASSFPNVCVLKSVDALNIHISAGHALWIAFILV